MKKTLLLIPLILFLIPCIAFGESNEIDNFLKGMTTFWDGVDTMVSDFTQKKKLELFDAEMVSSGKFAFKKPGTMIWRYDPPEETVMAVKPGVVTIYFKTNNKAMIIHLSGDDKLPQSMTFAFGGSGDIQGLKDKFNISLKSNEKGGTLTLIPKKKGDSDGFEKVVIGFKNDFTPASTTIYYSTDDVTTFEFSNVEINGSAKDEVFDFVLPRGVEIEEIGAGK